MRFHQSYSFFQTRVTCFPSLVFIEIWQSSQKFALTSELSLGISTSKIASTLKFSGEAIPSIFPNSGDRGFDRVFGLDILMPLTTRSRVFESQSRLEEVTARLNRLPAYTPSDAR